MFDSFYGLRARPFQLTPDASFFFESLTHRKALSYLGYGLAQGEGFIVITGEVGAGKSTLVSHLMATVDKARLTAAEVTTSRFDGEDMVAAVAQAFHLPMPPVAESTPGAGKAALLGAIEAFLNAEARSGRRCLLVVDESQNLSVGALEELRMLSNFHLGAHPLLQILLLGQPEFRDSLQDHPRLEQLRQRVIAAHHLEAMEPEEIEPYVLHRLGRVGWHGNPSFDAAIFPALYHATGGVPRRINQVANRLLILGAVEQRREIDAAMLDLVLEELEADGGLALSSAPTSRNALSSEPTGAAGAPKPENAAPEVVQATGLSHDITQALAERDAQIAELQQAVIELANSQDYPPLRAETLSAGTAEDIAALHDRLAQLEARILEQDRTLRHTLTMIIEWIERDEGQRAAA